MKFSQNYSLIFSHLLIVLFYLILNQGYLSNLIDDFSEKTDFFQEETFQTESVREFAKKKLKEEKISKAETSPLERQKEGEEEPNLKNQLIIYNRVPKCGSTTTLAIIDSLKKKLGYKTFNDIAPKMSHRMKTDEEELALIKKISQLEKPMIYIRHVYFLDFDRFAVEKPLYINIARDPVSHFISKFYYHRNGFAGEKNKNYEKWKYEMSDDQRSMTLDECVQTEATECKRPFLSLIPFFCGHSSICLKRGKEAVEIAKKNILKSYAIVGVTEDLPSTMRAFEIVAPEFFKGAYHLIEEKDDKLHEKTKTADKEEATPESLEYLKSKLSREYELYDFIKKTFYERIEEFKRSGLW